MLAAALERRFGQRVSKDNMLTRRHRQEGEALGTYAADVRFNACCLLNALNVNVNVMSWLPHV